MKNAVKRRLQIMTVLFSLAVFSFAWSIPVCAEESTEPAEVTQEEMDKAYDDAMMYGDSELTFLTMEEANYWLTVLMKYASGNLTEADFAELKDLLRAYFKPLEKGFTSADVSRFEEEREESKKSLEEYLRDKRFVASEEDFESLFKKYNSERELRYTEVRVDKEELEGFEQSLSSDSAHPIITEKFNV